MCVQLWGLLLFGFLFLRMRMSDKTLNRQNKTLSNRLIRVWARHEGTDLLSSLCMSLPYHHMVRKERWWIQNTHDNRGFGKSLGMLWWILHPPTQTHIHTLASPHSPTSHTILFCSRLQNALLPWWRNGARSVLLSLYSLFLYISLVLPADVLAT